MLQGLCLKQIIKKYLKKAHQSPTQTKSKSAVHYKSTLYLQLYIPRSSAEAQVYNFIPWIQSGTSLSLVEIAWVVYT